MLTKAQILEAGARLKTKTFTVEELGGDVTVREMDGKSRDAWESLSLRGFDPSTQTMKSTKQLRAKMVQLSVVDEDGKLMFKPTDLDDINALSNRVLDRICEEASAISALGEEEKDAIQGN